MRIGMILDKIFPPDPRVENEAISLIKNGFEVFLFCLSYSKEQSPTEVLNGIKVVRYNSNKLEYKFSALAYTFPFYTNLMRKKIKDFLIRCKIEAIHIHDIRIADAVFKANKKLKLPLVLDLHDNLPEIMKLYPHLNKFPGKYLISPKRWKTKEEEFIKNSDRVITVSKEFKEEVVSRIPSITSKVMVVPNTVRRSFYKEYEVVDSIIKKYKNNFVILYIGDTGIRRGLLTAIESIPLLSCKIANLKLVIVGSNTTDHILKAKVKELKVERFVTFEGWQDVVLFPSYILASSICISPLARNVQHDVAYANKLFQYMSFGKPVLVSNATAQKNLVERTKSGLVHKEKDSIDFAEKILTLYNTIDLRERLGNNGRLFIEKEFCWENTSKTLIQLYNELNI